MIHSNQFNNVIYMINNDRHRCPYGIGIGLMKSDQRINGIAASVFFTQFFEFAVVFRKKGFLFAIVGRIQKAIIKIKGYNTTIFTNCPDLVVLQVSGHRIQGIGAAVGYEHGFGGNLHHIVKRSLTHMRQINHYTQFIQAAYHLFPEVVQSGFIRFHFTGSFFRS
ncbi:hypothetical protein D9M68_666950 [compost metagenome]